MITNTRPNSSIFSPQKAGEGTKRFFPCGRRGKPYNNLKLLNMTNGAVRILIINKKSVLTGTKRAKCSYQNIIRDTGSLNTENWYVAHSSCSSIGGPSVDLLACMSRYQPNGTSCHQILNCTACQWSIDLIMVKKRK